MQRGGESRLTVCVCPCGMRLCCRGLVFVFYCRMDYRVKALSPVRTCPVEADMLSPSLYLEC
jgi:hypothetical protein